MAVIGKRKKNAETKKSEQEIVRIRDVGMGASPSRLLRLFRERELEPIDMVIRMNDQRKVVAFVTVPKDRAMNFLGLLDQNLDAWVLDEGRRRKLRSASGTLAALEKAHLL